MDPIAREKQRALKLFGEQPAEDLHPYAPPPGPLPKPRLAGDAPAPSQSTQMTLVAFGILSGALLGLVLLADDPDVLWQGPRKGLMVVSGGIGYINCVHVRLVGAAPLKKGDKGYTRALDVDGDGVACEPLIASKSDDKKPAKKPK
jgi:hypothetical protein